MTKPQPMSRNYFHESATSTPETLVSLMSFCGVLCVTHKFINSNPAFPCSWTSDRRFPILTKAWASLIHSIGSFERHRVTTIFAQGLTDYLRAWRLRGQTTPYGLEGRVSHSWYWRLRTPASHDDIRTSTH